MKKTVFTNAAFYWAIVSILGMLLLWNLYLAVTASKLFGLLPIIIQIVLLTLILRRHQYAKIGIKLWAIIFLIAGTGLQLLGRLIKDKSEDFANADLQHYLITGGTILLGIVILSYTNKTVEIVETIEEAEPISDDAGL